MRITDGALAPLIASNRWKSESQSYDCAALIARQHSDFGIACAAVPNVSHVADIKTALLEVANGTAWQVLVQHQSVHATPRVMI
jgi:hypothetical protein